MTCHEAAAAEQMRERCVAVLHARIQQWLAENHHLPEREQIGYPPFTLMEALNAIQALPIADGDEGRA